MKTIFTLLLLTLSKLAFSQNHCSDYKTGKFTYEGLENEMEITRTKHKQIELDKSTNQKSVLKIKWINDSTYVLTVKGQRNKSTCLKNGETINATIYKCEGKKNYVSYTSNCGNGKCVIIKLED
ncbi:MAG: hypothetical protein NT150_02200 [Bacteroidetes bacterium]|nr:hypothetical protein [Bacteroidota bacterium]